jgi:hypothetical protein
MNLWPGVVDLDFVLFFFYPTPYTLSPEPYGANVVSGCVGKEYKKPEKVQRS